MIEFASFWENPFLFRALLACLIIGFTNGFFSGVVVLRRSALVVSALSHTLLPGIVLAIFIGGALTQLSAFLGALFAALFVGMGSLVVALKSKVAQGTALAILYTTTFAAGVALLPTLNSSRGLEEWLFGDVLGVTVTDLWICLGIGLVTVVTLVALMRPTLLTLFEPNVAAAQGVPVKFIHAILFGLLVLTLVASLQAVGCVLSVGILVAPGASVSLLSNNPKVIFYGGGVVGALGAVAGLLLADVFGLAAGPCITMVLGLVFALAFTLSTKSRLLGVMKKFAE